MKSLSKVVHAILFIVLLLVVPLCYKNQLYYWQHYSFSQAKAEQIIYFSFHYLHNSKVYTFLLNILFFPKRKCIFTFYNW